MPVPPHTVMIYQKPKAGNNLLRRLPVYNYKHSINANGGFDVASFDIALRSVSEMQQFLDQYLGNRMSAYVDNPIEPIWEGFINRMSFVAGGVQYSVSLDQMANRLRVLYSLTGGSTTATQSATASNTESQAIYGIKQDQVDLGTMVNGTGVTILRDTALAQRAWPKASMMTSGGGSDLLHIECLGFYYTLAWEDYYQSTTANVQLGNFVDTLIGLCVNGTTFFDNTDLSDTAANTNLINQIAIKGDTIWDMLKKIQEMGDGTNYWVVGITPTLFQTGTRRAYYQQANNTIKYTARLADGLRIRNEYGRIVPPWLVRPDCGIAITDILLGWDGVGDNPTETYILKIDYDANAQTAVFAGDDDLTAEGIFNLHQLNRKQNQITKRIGANRRLA